MGLGGVGARLPDREAKTRSNGRGQGRLGAWAGPGGRDFRGGLPRENGGAIISVDRGDSAIFFSVFMKVVSSIKSAKMRHPACQVVRRKGKIYVIN